MIEKKQIEFGPVDIANWKTVNIDKLSDEKKEKYIKRKEAIDLYLKDKNKVEEISKITGVYKEEITRLVKRCLQIDEEGEMWGYRALLPYKRLKSYDKKYEGLKSDETVNFTGAFSLLLKRYPKIKEKIHDSYLNKEKDSIDKTIISIKYIYKKFLAACHEENISENDYPFNTKDKGRRTLYSYLKDLENKLYSQSSKRYGKDVQRYANSTGKGTNSNLEILRPYERVQFDGHRIDAIFSLTFKTLEGDEITSVLERIWLLVIIDVATRAVLSYHISLNQEFTAYDVLLCIKKAIVPKEKIEFTIPGFKYSEGGGFASLRIPETQWASWNELLYDNAKANLSKYVRDKLTRVIGCSVNAGPVQMPERRGIIERFFRTLEENGFHRLPSTTGSNIKDPRRNKPEEKAIKYNISIDHLEEITELLIANYNETPHDGISGFTPLELMQQRIDRGLIPSQMVKEKQDELLLLSINVQRTVRGSVKSGKRPFINFEGAQYRSEVLSRSPSLIGTKLDLLVNPTDIRVVKAFLPDGAEFGFLTAVGKWGVIPHTLQLRKEINKAKSKKLIHFTESDDPIETYNKHLLLTAKQKKSSRNKLAKLQDNIKNYKNDTAVETEMPINSFSTTKIGFVDDNKTNRLQHLKDSKIFKTYNF